jgi:hypothetical protein
MTRIFCGSERDILFKPLKRAFAICHLSFAIRHLPLEEIARKLFSSMGNDESQRGEPSVGVLTYRNHSENMAFKKNISRCEPKKVLPCDGQAKDTR